MLRMADLGEENRGSHLGQTVTESKNETTSDIHAVSIGESSEETSDNHDRASNSNGNFASPPIGHIWDDWVGGQRTNLVDGIHQTCISLY